MTGASRDTCTDVYGQSAALPMGQVRSNFLVRKLAAHVDERRDWPRQGIRRRFAAAVISSEWLRNREPAEESNAPRMYDFDAQLPSEERDESAWVRQTLNRGCQSTSNREGGHCGSGLAELSHPSSRGHDKRGLSRR